jgi:hypothetical protein
MGALGVGQASALEGQHYLDWMEVSGMGAPPPVSGCDVPDRPKLTEFRRLRDRWIRWFSDSTGPSIWGQVATMLWDDAVFRLVKAMWVRASASRDPAVGVNRAVLGLIGRGYIAAQATCVRRLVEKNPDVPAKAVISLRRAIDDVEAHRDLITRENYVAHDGCPYDPAQAERREAARVLRGSTTSLTFHSIPSRGPGAYLTSELRHHNFDRMSRTSPDGRSRTDLIPRALFCKLRENFGGCESVVAYCDKVIAHTADPTQMNEPAKRRLARVSKRMGPCRKVLCQTASFVYSHVLDAGTHALMPIPGFYVLEFLERPWAAEARLPGLHASWERRVEGVKKWQATLWSDLL